MVEDGSYGIHNLSYAVGLLKESIAILTGDANSDGIADSWQIQYFGSANNPSAAEKRFQAALSKEPNDESVTLAYVSFLQSQKAPIQQRKELLTNLVKNQPGAIRGPMLLIATLIETGQGQDAVTVASQGLATDPENPTLLRALGAAQLAARHPT